MPRPTPPPLTIENLEFVYRPNFEGRRERYNEEGNRYFNARIPDDLVPVLERDGWNLKYTKPSATHPNPDEFVPVPFVEVTVGYSFRPPTIIFIRDGHQTPIPERQVSLVDVTEFSNIDVTIRGYPWESEVGQGVKAYLKSFYGTVEMDDLDRKYFVPPREAGSDDEDLD